MELGKEDSTNYFLKGKLKNNSPQVKALNIQYNNMGPYNIVYKQASAQAGKINHIQLERNHIGARERASHIGASIHIGALREGIPQPASLS